MRNPNLPLLPTEEESLLKTCLAYATIFARHQEANADSEEVLLPFKNDLLLVAAKNNNYYLVQYLGSQKNVDLNHRDLEGNSALHLATKNLDAKTVQNLVMMGADVDATNHEHETAESIIKNAEAQGYSAEIISNINYSLSRAQKPGYKVSFNNLIDFSADLPSYQFSIDDLRLELLDLELRTYLNNIINRDRYEDPELAELRDAIFGSDAVLWVPEDQYQLDSEDKNLELLDVYTNTTIEDEGSEIDFDQTSDEDQNKPTDVELGFNSDDEDQPNTINPSPKFSSATNLSGKSQNKFHG